MIISTSPIQIGTKVTIDNRLHGQVRHITSAYPTTPVAEIEWQDGVTTRVLVANIIINKQAPQI